MPRSLPGICRVRADENVIVSNLEWHPHPPGELRQFICGLIVKLKSRAPVIDAEGKCAQEIPTYNALNVPIQVLQLRQGQGKGFEARARRAADRNRVENEPPSCYWSRQRC